MTPIPKKAIKLKSLLNGEINALTADLFLKNDEEEKLASLQIPNSLGDKTNFLTEILKMRHLLLIMRKKKQKLR